PWVSFLPDHQKTAATSGGLRRALSARLERLCLRHARAVITNSQHLAGEMRAAFPNLAVCWIPNGTDPERLPRTKHEPFPGLSLAYVGSLYVGRDLQPVLRALQLFLRRNPDAQADGTRLRVAGAMAPEHQARFVAQVEELALQKHVEFLGTLPPADALTLLHRSTLAIVLAQQQRMQVPAKIYESVSLHVPTLVVTESDSASAKESDRIGAISIEPDNIEAMVTLFEELWSGSRPRRTPPRVPVDYAGLAEEMARTLNSVIEPAHAHNG
ncbi:MAG TPA: glycosyltransferase, partial [Steroidobacteraceae bacterium]